MLQAAKVTKIVKETKFEWQFKKLEAKICFKRESSTKYFRQIYFCFSGVFHYNWQNFDFRDSTEH